MIEDDPILGAFVAVHPSDRLRPLVLAGLVVGSLGLVLSVTLATVETWWGPVMTVLIMGTVTLAAGWYLLHLWNREVVLYQHGFTYREGSQIIPFRYDEIKSIRQHAEQLAYFGGRVRRAVYRIVLTSYAGDTIVLDNTYRSIDALGPRLESLVNTILRPKVERAIAQGNAVPFSNTLRLSERGLHDGENVLAWQDFGGFRAANRRLVLLNAAGDDWAAVPLSEVDNLRLLADLLRERSAVVSEARPNI